METHCTLHVERNHGITRTPDHLTYTTQTYVTPKELQKFLIAKRGQEAVGRGALSIRIVPPIYTSLCHHGIEFILKSRDVLAPSRSVA